MINPGFTPTPHPPVVAWDQSFITPTSPAPTGEDSENVPLFLWTFTAIGTTTIEAARVHVRIRARSLPQAQARILKYLGYGYKELTLVEVQEVAPEPPVS